MPIFIKRFLGRAGIPKVKLILPSECIGTEILSLYQSMITTNAAKEFYTQSQDAPGKATYKRILKDALYEASELKIDMSEIMRELYTELKKEIEEQNNG